MGDENKLSVIIKLTFFVLNKSWHRVVELTGTRPVKDGSTCLTETQCRVLYIWGLGLALSTRYHVFVTHQAGMVGKRIKNNG